MAIKVLEKESIADVAFLVESASLNKLFEECAGAVFSQIADAVTVRQKVKKVITARAKTLPELLHSFLEEIVFLKDAEQLVFNDCHAIVNGNQVTATLYGEKIDRKRNRLLNDVKAVTWNSFKAERKGKKYVAKFVLDI